MFSRSSTATTVTCSIMTDGSASRVCSSLNKHELFLLMATLWQKLKMGMSSLLVWTRHAFESIQRHVIKKNRYFELFILRENMRRIFYQQLSLQDELKNESLSHP